VAREITQRQLRNQSGDVMRALDAWGELRRDARVTLAELAAGPHATADRTERARRQDRLQRAEATFTPPTSTVSTR
jgi:hypothetical protein